MPQCYDFDYQINQPRLLPNVWIPCPSGDNCCIGIDTCLSNNLCKAYSGSKEKRTGTYSGYYNARCTDPTYTSPACDKICLGSPPDLVYNYTSQVWACCGNNTAGEVTCSNPLPEYYDAPAPALLATLSSGARFASTATLTPVSTPTHTVSTTSASSSTINPSSTGSDDRVSSTATATTLVSQSSNSAGATSGAKIGIGVAVTVGVLLIIAGILLYLRRRTVTARHKPAPQEVDSYSTKPIQEMSDNINRAPVEMDVPKAAIEVSEHNYSMTPSNQFSFHRGQSTYLMSNRAE